jgi:hypothetical protein
MTPLKLPIDLQSFEIIRREGFLYVDKTPWIHRMLAEGRYYFLARPRRFGKTLMVSTLRNLFAGNRDLFKGLWIDTHGNWSWEAFPVILLDFNAISHDTPENFKAGLTDRLNRIADEFGLKTETILLKEQFQSLILSLYRKTGRPVVILIDEYDKPIIDHLGKGDSGLDIARANRDILKSFLGTLKGADVASHTRFVFITGVSKFSRVSIFSDLNNLIDITMDDRYAAMLGYTEEELSKDFGWHLQRLHERLKVSLSQVVEQLRGYYDGYRFSEAAIQVYNPFSLLRALELGRIKNYWFESGTPSFLIHLLRQSQYDLPQIEEMQVSEQIFSVYELERLSIQALLFQTGYVTIKDVKDRLFTLGYPNQEVKTSFVESLLYSFAPPEKADGVSRFLLLAGYLRAEDLQAFFETVNAIFATIPYTLKGAPNEAWFHTLFYLMVAASGVDAQNEILTSRGRIDLVVHFPDKTWIIEFKCSQSPEAGLKQIHEKGYADPYKGLGKKLLLLGIGFDPKMRQVAGWQVEAV